MKAGTAWYGFRQFTASNYLATAAALDLTFVEVPLYGQVIHDYLFETQDSAAVRRLAEETGVVLHAGVAALEFATPFNIRGLPISEEVIAFHKVLARRVIDLGAELGLEVVRLTEPNIEEPHLEIADRYMETYGAELQDLGAYAEQRGVRIVAENYGVTSAQMRTLLDAADHPNVGTLFDPCNYFRMGEDPVAALELVGDRVFYCHMKDSITSDPRTSEQLFPGSRWRPSVAVGRGDIDWDALLPALASVYSGVVAMECEMPNDVVAATTQSRDFLVAKAGASLSLGAEA